ncbi:MAG: peptidylprolyl isomerase [Planctomycetota bacterium]|nr:peptidylprolyl isomerase [Planctomycetota bacterium]
MGRFLVVAILLASCATHHQAPPLGARDPAAERPVRDPSVSEPDLKGDGRSNHPAPPKARLPGNPVVASYEGREIRAAELGQWFLKTYRREALASLSKLIGLEIVEREAKRIGLSCPPSHLADKRKEIMGLLERDAAVTYGIGAKVERYVRLRYQQSLSEHLAIRLEEARQRWLFSRIIRFEAMRTDRVELAMIVTKDRRTMEDVKSRLDQGADFARVAQRYSVHESKQRGGRLPPLPREALNPVVASRAFELKVGECTGVLDIDDGRGHRQYEIVRLLGRLPGRTVTWSSVEDEVEAGLKERPVDPMEWTAWYLRLERLYSVRVSSNL